MIKRIVLLSWLLATLINPDSFSQSKSELKINFFDAESWILFEAYKDALPLYQQLLRSYPENANFKYRIGQCYINIPGEKEKAISYLEDAVKNINPRYRDGKFREEGAPYDALYYLANAYRINNQLDKALETYDLFKQNLDPEIYDSTVVNLQIQSCHNAKELMSMPLFIKEKNLGDMINDGNSESYPVISFNEDLLVYSKSLAFYDALLYSTKTNGVWSGPINMNEILKFDRDIYPTSISKDGQTLYLYSSADYDGTIYTTRIENGTWTPLVRLNENINTKYWESHAAISHDDKKLYFTSNRKGTYGGLDIYVSKRDTSGNWGPAENLGPVINTPYNEESPFLSQDDKTLFFSSRGHFNMGGYDIFYSTFLENNQWSVPLNVGYPLNSTDDDVFFKPMKDGYEGYYAKESNDGFGKEDIYRIEIFSDDHPRKFFVRGMVKVADVLSSFRDSVKISAMNITNPDQTLIVYSNPITGEYEFELPQGNYQITYESDAGEKVVRDLELPLTMPADSFVLPGTILPKTDLTAELKVGSNKTISVAKGDSILFPLEVEPNSLLTIEHWVGDSLLSVENFVVSDSIFYYKMLPLSGDNKLVFKLTDRFNNTTTTDIIITREKEVQKKPVVRPEYSRVIAEKQVDALTAILKNRSNANLIKIIAAARASNKQFGKIDDIISAIREEAVRNNIAPEEIDKLALKVAVMDNILTQAAVDLMAGYTEGDLKKILSDLDIEESDITTWTDLQEYILLQTGGEISPEELNEIAAAILSGTDPAILKLRKQILAYSEHAEEGDIIRQSVAAVDIQTIKIKSKWLQAFFSEATKLGLSGNQLSELMAMISSRADTPVEEFLRDLIEHAEEPLRSLLKSIDLKKEKIKSPKDLIMFLTNNKDRFPEDAVYNSIASLITDKDLPAGVIADNAIAGKEKSLWILWIILGAGLLFLFFIFKKRKKSERE